MTYYSSGICVNMLVKSSTDIIYKELITAALEEFKDKI